MPPRNRKTPLFVEYFSDGSVRLWIKRTYDITEPAFVITRKLTDSSRKRLVDVSYKFDTSILLLNPHAMTVVIHHDEV